VLAVATLAWASASSYLSSQALANTRSNLHATLRLLHFRRSLSSLVILCLIKKERKQTNQTRLEG